MDEAEAGNCKDSKGFHVRDKGSALQFCADDGLSFTVVNRMAWSETKRISVISTTSSMLELLMFIPILQ